LRDERKNNGPWANILDNADPCVIVVGSRDGWKAVVYDLTALDVVTPLEGGGSQVSIPKLEAHIAELKQRREPKRDDDVKGGTVCAKCGKVVQAGEPISTKGWCFPCAQRLRGDKLRMQPGPEGTDLSTLITSRLADLEAFWLVSRHSGPRPSAVLRARALAQLSMCPPEEMCARRVLEKKAAFQPEATEREAEFLECVDPYVGLKHDIGIPARPRHTPAVLQALDEQLTILRGETADPATSPLQSLTEWSPGDFKGR
jgi:hypothetical protein